MEYIAGGNLKEMIEKRMKFNKWFSENETIEIIKGILNGIFYLHSKNIAHRDIKPGILIYFYLNIVINI